MVKRAFDILFSLTALVIVSPALLVAAALVRVLLGTPIFFRQERPGLHGNLFTLCKFRTMTNSTDDQGQLLSDEQRLTWFGKLLRASSIDELPQLLNVLMGDMSIVGPRPLLPDYLPLYSPRHAKRHDVRPGLTGWAQVNGRNLVSWEERFDMDVWYVEHQSFALDCKIILRTIRSVCSMRGVRAKDHVTMSKYSGIQVVPSNLSRHANQDEPEDGDLPTTTCANGH